MHQLSEALELISLPTSDYHKELTASLHEKLINFQ